MNEIRHFRDRDASAICRVFESAIRAIGPRDYSAQQIEAWIANAPSEQKVIERCSDGRVTLVSVDRQGEINAYIDLEPDGHIDHLYRNPIAQTSNVALSLYEKVESLAEDRNIKVLYTEASEAAKRFFERRGFTTKARREIDINGVQIHNFSMEKRLCS